MLKYILQRAQLFSPRLLFAGSSMRQSDVEDGALLEILEILNEYRSRKNRHETLFIESAVPLSLEDKEDIKINLRLPLSTRVVEHINPSLGSSFQIMYKNQIYTFVVDNNRLERLKTLFVHTR
jgi:F0F1-type ATP synthase delta subunit